MRSLLLPFLLLSTVLMDLPALADGSQCQGLFTDSYLKEDDLNLLLRRIGDDNPRFARFKRLLEGGLSKRALRDDEAHEFAEILVNASTIPAGLEPKAISVNHWATPLEFGIQYPQGSKGAALVTGHWFGLDVYVTTDRRDQRLVYEIPSVAISNGRAKMEYDDAPAGLDQSFPKFFVTILYAAAREVAIHPEINQIRIVGNSVVNRRLMDLLKSFGFTTSLGVDPRETQGRNWVLSLKLDPVGTAP